jgi:hypothetical protein
MLMPSGAIADGPGDAFRKQVRAARFRYHLEQLTRASWSIAWGLAGGLSVALILALLTPVAAEAMLIALAFLLLALGAALGIYLRKIDRHRLLVRMDAHGKLSDSVLTAGDWESAPADPWRERQRLETLRLLEKIDWRKAWPVRWPSLLWLPLATSLFLIVILALVQSNWTQQTRRAHLAEDLANAPVTAQQLQPLEQVFQDWDAAQKIAPSPELEKLLQDLKPMRDQMAEGKMTEKQVLLKLNEVQARLQAQKDQLEASSMEPTAQSIADAVKDLDGMSGLAAALQRKDFAAAKEQAAQAAEKYKSGQAKMPEGANAQTAASKLSDAAQKASGDKQASSSLSQMKDGVSNKDGAEMRKGLGGLKDSLAQQAQRDTQGKNLGTQLAQLGDAKNGMGQKPGDGQRQGKGQGAGMQMGLPQLSLAKSLEQQKGAGMGADPNQFGAQTQLDANHQQVKITGTAGAGPSEKQTESTNDPHMEKTASGVDQAQFDAYKKLSDQATEDENLPVADRQMIKRYFEDIRPQSNP